MFVRTCLGVPKLYEDADEAWEFVSDFYAEHPAPAPTQSGPPE